jgi:hypothetical protein
MQKETRQPGGNELVSSFESGIITSKGDWVGVCLKLSMFDRSEKIMHWPMDRFVDLMTSLETYANSLGNNAFMIQAQANPKIVENISDRHPYHTLLSEKPKLTLDEVGTTGPSSSVFDADFVLRGPTFEIRPVFADQHTECIFFHEYTALSMFLYLDSYLEAGRKLSGPVGGNA